MYTLETKKWKLEINKGPEESDYVYVLSDKISGRVYSDMDYYYGLSCEKQGGQMPEELLRGEIDPQLIVEMFQPPERPKLVCREVEKTDNGITVNGGFDNGLRFIHNFSVSADESRLIETITLENAGSSDIAPIRIDFGFRKMLLTQRGGWQEDIDFWRLEALPTRRFCSQKVERRMEYYTASDLLYAPFDDEEDNLKPGFAAEGWIWGTEEGRILINKYNPSEIEFSRFRRFPIILKGRGLENTALLFGGAAQYRGDPERSASLKAGASYTFGKSCYTFFEGRYEDGALLYRSFLEAQGHGLKPDYNPKVHWNELYNLGWFAELSGFFSEGSEFKLYNNSDLFGEAELASRAGAKVLYLDPGWDTEPGSTIWDESRLGKLEEFSRIIHQRFGLKLALHLMMCFWSADEKEYFYWRDTENRPSRDPEDTLLFRFCPNKRWVEEKTKRLAVLASAGVDFFMFDFTSYGLDGLGCSSPDHGHEVPMSRQTHAENILSVMRNIKKQFPTIVIEAHDRIRGGLSDYHPVYFQEREKVFDELWGYEFMWNPLQDLLSGKALSLYEYNIASPVPLYLHINSACDNSSMLQFWWYASTVRHLGIGGIEDENTQEFLNLQSAMSLYERFRKYLVNGIFYGLEPLVHLHVLKDRSGCLITAYNLSGSSQSRTIQFKPEDYGMRDFTAEIVSYNGVGKIGEIEKQEIRDGAVVIEMIIPPLSPVILYLS